MPRKRNFLPLAGFLVCVVAFISYFAVLANVPVTRDVPWLSWLVFALGLGLLGAGIVRAFRQPEIYKGRIAGPVFGALSLAVVGFFLFLTVVWSRQLPPPSAAVQVGQAAPDFTLADTRNQPVHLQELLRTPAGGGPGSWVLLIFYRGTW
jgi:hypothetical protein